MGCYSPQINLAMSGKDPISLPQDGNGCQFALKRRGRDEIIHLFQETRFLLLSNGKSQVGLSEA